MYTTFIKKSRKIKQLSLEDFLINLSRDTDEHQRTEKFVTIKHEKVFNSTLKFISKNVINYTAENLIQEISNFILKFKKENDNKKFESIKNKLYYKFRIPKNKGGYREITAIENTEFANLQKSILEKLTYSFGILPHNASFAYVKNRNSIMNAQTHKNNTFIVKLDLKDFFTSITKEMVYESLLELSNISALRKGKTLAGLIASVSTLNDSLPQGSHLSPFLSNIVMLKFDHRIYEDKTKGIIHNFTYTRYADDLTFSCNNPARIHELPQYITNILNELYNGKLKVNTEKTKVLKNTSRLYITGVKLNKDKNATYGHEKKSALKLDLCNLFIAKEQNTCSKEQAQEILGKVAYMSQIEPNYTAYLVKKYLRKFNSSEATLGQHFKEFL